MAEQTTTIAGRREFGCEKRTAFHKLPLFIVVCVIALILTAIFIFFVIRVRCCLRQAVLRKIKEIKLAEREERKQLKEVSCEGSEDPTCQSKKGQTEGFTEQTEATKTKGDQTDGSNSVHDKKKDNKKNKDRTKEQDHSKIAGFTMDGNVTKDW